MAPARNRRWLLRKILILARIRRRNIIRQNQLTAAAQRAATRARKRKRRWWVRPAWQKRNQQGDFFTLYPTLRTDDREMFFRLV